MGNMFNVFGIRYGWRITRDLKNSFLSACEALPFHFGESMSQEEKRIHLASVTVMRMVLTDARGMIDPEKLDTFRRLLESEYNTAEVEQRIAELKRLTPLEPDAVAESLKLMPPEDRKRLLDFILALASATRAPESVLESLRGIFSASGVDGADFDAMCGNARDAEERRQRIIGSGAGILAALVVILVFIITATLLRSVIFGLILAYLLLPLEKYFECRQREKRGAAYYLFRIISLPLLPLQRLSQRITRRASSDGEADVKRSALRKERTIITQAVTQTVLTVLLAFGVFAYVIYFGAAHYVGGYRSLHKSNIVQVSGNATSAADEQRDVKSGGDPAVERAISQVDHQLKRFMDRFQNLPLIKVVLDNMVSMLRSEESRRELTVTLLKSSGGIFYFTAGVLGSIVSLVCDLLLTVFFALLFLVKIAEFCRDDESTGRKSEYLVRTVFNGKWLPDANDATVVEAKRIVGGIMDRLRIWAHGYLKLIMIDSMVYIFVFWWLRVPYFPVLGLLAGCGILLPYIGPVISASLTVLVTLAFGDSSGIQLIGIIVAYLIYNGIFEQFILYPAVIGESLGLTTLETIVVVLLGAVFAGIPGMFLALPAASVLKYIIPQIHNYLRTRRGADAAR